MKNSKDLFINTLEKKKPERFPCALHWWGTYKYESLGLDFMRDAWREGEAIVPVYTDFYEKFRPDWFHLHIGTPKYFKDSEIIGQDGKPFLRIAPEYRALKKDDKYFSVNSTDDEEIVDFPDYLLGSRSYKPKVDLSSDIKIDEYMKRYVHMSAEEIIGMGYTEHIPPIVKKYGDKVFIAVHIPSAVCEIFDPTTGYVGFENGLMAFIEEPHGMSHLLEKCYESQLEWAKAYAKAGAHAYIISETYISPDIANPSIYRNFLKGIHRDYFAEIKGMGLYPVCHFFGDINPLLDDLTEVNLSALMVEESKKQFTLEITEIREKLNERICLVGNLDSITLLRNGKPEKVRKEALRQIEGAEKCFIAANGSPVAMETPEVNVKAFIETVKNYRP